MEDTGGLECVWGKLSEHPKCPHGPTLLFVRYTEDNAKKFYVCSACRDRKLCSFYAENTELTKQQKQTWEQEKKKVLPYYNHRTLCIRFNEMMVNGPLRRAYCYNCEELISTSEKDKDKHKDHEIKEALTDYQMQHPTTILKPLENAKKEAQYLFSKKSTEDIVNMLLKLGAEGVLCIGAPRIHEYILENLENKVSSLLLDIDGRFHNFFGPLNYCWYNLFNHHFFNEEGKDVFKDFVTQNAGKNLFVICDPPFGGRLEPMSQTIKTISDSYKKWNKIESPEQELGIFFIFPYFRESAIREKCNPPGVEGGLKGLKMSDYKVDYENHPLFTTGSKGRKYGSPVRIFTNIPLKLLQLPEADGYKYCKRCEKWTSSENKHCKKCKECTSKDGRRYKHCDICQRCVKPTWKHCDECGRCALEDHECGQTPKLVGRCFQCNEFGHVEKDCEASNEVLLRSSKPEKRKNESNVESPKKKRKTDDKKTSDGESAKRKKTKAAKVKKSEAHESAAKNASSDKKGMKKSHKKENINSNKMQGDISKAVKLQKKKLLRSNENANSTGATKKSKKELLSTGTKDSSKRVKGKKVKAFDKKRCKK